MPPTVSTAFPSASIHPCPMFCGLPVRTRRQEPLSERWKKFRRLAKTTMRHLARPRLVFAHEVRRSLLVVAPTLWLLLLAKLITPPLIPVPLLPPAVQAPSVDSKAMASLPAVAAESKIAIPDEYSSNGSRSAAVDAASDDAQRIEADPRKRRTSSVTETPDTQAADRGGAEPTSDAKPSSRSSEAEGR